MHNSQMTKTGTTFEGITLGRTERFLKEFPEIKEENQGHVQWIEENPQRPRNIWLREVKISWFGAQGKYGGKLVTQDKAKKLEFTIGSLYNFLSHEKDEEKEKKKQSQECRRTEEEQKQVGKKRKSRGTVGTKMTEKKKTDG